MKIFKFKKINDKLVGGWEVEDDKEIKGYVYGYGKDLESARKDAEMALEYDNLDFDSLDEELERDAKEQWYKEIWEN